MTTQASSHTPAADDALAERLASLPYSETMVAKCLELGLTMRRAPTYDITHPAITLTPYTMNADVLRTLQERQLLWNEATDRTARNYAFLANVLRETAESDKAFTGRLLDMMKRVYLHAPADGSSTGPVYQPLMLGIFRTDYMRSITSAEEAAAETAEQWRNVEINTISCSFAGLSSLVVAFHQFLATYRAAIQGTNSASVAAPQSLPSSSSSAQMAPSESSTAVPEALSAAVDAWTSSVPLAALQAEYQRTHNTTHALLPIVLVVIQEGERNTGDQFKLLLQLLETHHVVSLRRTHADIHKTLELVHVAAADEANGGHAQPPFAVVDGKYVAAVVYYRSAYVPGDYPTEATWQAREDLERSNAIKCPSLPHHLMTLKKIQQLFTNIDDVLVPIAFNGDRDKAEQMAKHFMPQYSLNQHEFARAHAEGTKRSRTEADANSAPAHPHLLAGDVDPEEIIQRAIAHPDKFVLKPQLEGGGNLIAGAAMQALLRDSKADDPATAEAYHRIRNEYILMEKIHYASNTGVLFRQGEVHVMRDAVCSELGIYGTVLSNENVDAPLLNASAGYVVRTKPSAVEDGGVMAGVACLDCVQYS